MKLNLNLAYKFALVTALLVGCFVYLEAQTVTEPATGDGSTNNPYQIASLENLYWLAASNDVVPAPDQTVRWSSHYIQTTDIEASETENWFEGQGWSPIGNYIMWNHPDNLPFTGSYNSHFCFINGIFIDRPDKDCVGLFGYTFGATIENLDIINIDVKGNRSVGGLVGWACSTYINNSSSTGNMMGNEEVGGLVGWNDASTISNSYNAAYVTGSQCVGGLVGTNHFDSTISNCYSTGNVNGDDFVGGLVGLNNPNSLISNCNNTGNVTGNTFIGGLVGNNNSPINECYNTGSVSGSESVGGLIGFNNSTISYNHNSGSVIGSGNDYSVGGLVGENYYSTINSCYNDGSVNAAGQYAGGLVGQNYYSTISKSYSTGCVIGNFVVGGLVGWNAFSSINDSYSTGSVNGNRNVGGLAGNCTSSTIINCYSIGSVNGTYYSGGLVGSNPPPSTISNSYYNLETSEQSDTGKGEPRTTIEMTYPCAVNTYSDWDFNEIWGEDIDFLKNNGYPYLLWQVFGLNLSVAINPEPQDNSENVSVNLQSVSWTYPANDFYTFPIGFRVYFNDTGDFNENDYVWIPFIEGEHDYRYELNSPLDYFTNYYWKVVPTTTEPDVTFSGITHKTHSNTSCKNKTIATRDDAENCPVWSFQTEIDTSTGSTVSELVTHLSGNYPNPFNPETTINFSIKDETNADLMVYNIKGQVVKSLHRGFIQAGEHKVIWNGTDNNNNKIGSGIYFYRLTTDNYDRVNKMIMVK